MANYKRRWTTEDRETLVMLHAKGVPKLTIAKLLNRTGSAITAQIHVLKKRKSAVKEFDLFAVDTIPYYESKVPKVPKEAETMEVDCAKYTKMRNKLGKLESEMERVKNFTFWDRVVTWPYKRLPV